MPIPPIEDSYIDAIIKSDGPYNPALNRTQGVKLRELMKRFRDYFEEQTPKLISQLANDSGYVTSSIIDGLANDTSVLHKTGDEAKSGNLAINGALQVSNRVDLNYPLNIIGGMIVDSSNDGRNMDLRLAYNNEGIWTGFRVDGETKTISAGYFPFNNSVIFDGRNIYDNTGVHFLKEGDVADATELAPGIVELATIAEALTRTDDQKAMTALKTIALILDEKKEVSYQVNPVGVTEVSFLMENAGQVNAILISGANSPKLKIGASGSYPEGEQVFPFAYSASDRVFVSFNYNDLLQMSCNIKLKCKDN